MPVQDRAGKKKGGMRRYWKSIRKWSRALTSLASTPASHQPAFGEHNLGQDCIFCFQ